MGYLDLWNISRDELNQLLDENPSLRGMVLGYVAELKLAQRIDRIPGMTRSIKYDDHDRTKKSDRLITYHGHDFHIEVKSLQTNSIQYIEPTTPGDKGYHKGTTQVDASDSRIVTFPNGETLKTTCLLVGDFDVLAVNIFAFMNEWQFLFAKNSDLPRSTYSKYSPYQRQYLLATSVPVTWPPTHPFYTDPLPLLEQIIQERIS